MPAANEDKPCADAIIPPIAAPKEPPSINATRVRPRQESCRRGLSGATAVGALGGEAINHAVDVAGAVMGTIVCGLRGWVLGC